MQQKIHAYIRKKSMKKRTTQLLSLMISAAMIASTPCLIYAADFSSETLLSDSEEAAIWLLRSTHKPELFLTASLRFSMKKQPGMHLIHWPQKQTESSPMLPIYRLQGKTWKAIGNTKNTTYTDKKPGTATKYRIRAYRITNGKKIYGPYSSVRTVK